MGVEPLGRFFTSPEGVKQNTLSENRSRSLFKESRNSLLSDISFCHSRIWRSQESFSSALSMAAFVLPLCLYFQWAAIPYSATLCIS